MLHDLLVLDLSRVLAGPYCTQILADLGARVIKIEPPHGDETRTWGPPFAGDQSGYFLSVNRGKESVVLDLKHPDGRRLAAGLAARADLLVQNFKVGDLDRYGLGYDRVAATNPGILYASITGFGDQGPRARQPGYDAALQAISGLMAMTGEPDGGPVKLGVAWIDVLTGLHAAVSLLAALHERQRTGLGRHLRLSLFEVGLASLVNQAQGVLLTGRAPARMGSEHPSIVPYGAFPVADGHVAIAVGNDAQFARLAQAVGAAGWPADPRFRTNADRVRNRTALTDDLEERLRAGSRSDWLERLAAAGVPAAPVHDLAEALADAQAQALGTVGSYLHPSAGRVPYVRSPLRHQTAPDGSWADSWAGAEGDAAVDAAPPPTLGQHTVTVLRELLDLPEEEIAALASGGAVRTG